MGARTLPRVLLVDDGAESLDDLRDVLAGETHRWDLALAATADEALRIVVRDPVDAMVVRAVPAGVQGRDLLAEMYLDHPGVIRVAVADDTPDVETTARGRAHQWISRRADRTEVVRTIASALGDLDQRSGLVDQIVGAVDSLPSPPSVYLDLMAALDDPGVGFEVLGKLIERDPAISAKLLQWGNSAFFGGGSSDRVSDVVRTVGVNAVTQLVLSAGVLEQMAPEDEIPGCSSETLRLRCELTGTIAAGIVSRGDAVAARTAGLLHEIGLLLLATNARPQLDEALQLANEQSTSLTEAELDCLEVDHAAIGGRLLALWGLPAQIVDAVRDHLQSAPDSDGDVLSIAAAVRVGHWLSGVALAESGELDAVFIGPSPVDDDVAERAPDWLTRAESALTAAMGE